MLALGSFIAHPRRIHDFSQADGRPSIPCPEPREVVESLRPPWWSSLRVGAEALSGAASERYRSLAGDADAATLDELTGDDFSSATDDRPTSAWLSPIAITMAVAVVASLVAARSLFGRGFLAGPALLPAHDSILTLWRTVVAADSGRAAQVTPPWGRLSASARRPPSASRNGSARCCCAE